MTGLLRPLAVVSVDVSGDTVVAGRLVEVTVRVVAERPMVLSGGEVELLRRGAVGHIERGWMGAGCTVSFRRSALAARAELDVAGPLDAGQQLVRRVTLTVPPGEATVSGFLVQQEYSVRARIRAAVNRHREGVTGLRVTSPAAERGWAADRGPVIEDAGFAVLGIEELATRRLSGGVPIRGVVTVQPRQGGTARSLRVELVLDELVPARGEEPLEEDRHAQTVAVTATVAEHLDLEQGRVLRLPFVLRVPLPLPAPSISTEEFTLRWLLRAVLDLPRRADPQTTLELCGATAS